MINVAIVGFGNVGKGVLRAVDKTPDMVASVILTRRPDAVASKIRQMGLVIPVKPFDDMGKIPVDVAILCGGSKEDLWTQGPTFAERYPTVDSFDTHGLIPKYLEMMDKSAKKGGNIAIISTGWDPGLFSMMKLWGHAFLNLRVYTFYGLGKRGGLSMGHSNAIRDNVSGVLDARSYTHAIPDAIERVRAGENPELKPGDMHWRECFVVTEKGADLGTITGMIKSMPDYFFGYRTTVKFINQEEMGQDHKAMFHDGVAIAVGETSLGNKSVMEFQCQWDSNPESTAKIMVACARAATRMKKQGVKGAFTILDIPPGYLSSFSREESIRHFM